MKSRVSFTVGRTVPGKCSMAILIPLLFPYSARSGDSSRTRIGSVSRFLGLGGTTYAHSAPSLAACSIPRRVWLFYGSHPVIIIAVEGAVQRGFVGKRQASYVQAKIRQSGFSISRPLHGRDKCLRTGSRDRLTWRGSWFPGFVFSEIGASSARGQSPRRVPIGSRKGSC